MNKRNIIVQVLVIGVVVFSFFLFKSKKTPIVSGDNVVTLQRYDKISKEYQGQVLSDLINDRSALNHDFFENLKEINNSTHILLIRFSEIHCSSCMVRDTNLLKKYMGDTGWDNAILAASYSNEDYFQLFKRVHGIDKEILKIDSYFLPLDNELTDTPYYIILDKNLKIVELFISTKLSEERTEKFFYRIFNNDAFSL